jgi:hypothetical protein
MSSEKKPEPITVPEKAEEKPAEPPKKKTRFHTDPYVKAEF